MTTEPAGILVVDDLPEQRMAIEATLADLGEPMVSVTSGVEALKYLLDHEVAVILLDVNMPEMDGFETADLIRRRPRSAQTPIIFLTADHDAMQAMRGYALGAVDYLTCPFLPDVLRTKVGVFVALNRAKERIRAEADRHVALQREQAARVAAEEKNRQMRLLGEAAAMIAGSLEGAPFEDDLLAVLVPSFAEEAAIVFRDEADGVTRVRMAAGYSGDLGAPDLADLCRQAVSTGAIMTGSEDPGGLPGRLALPLFVADRTIAALAVARRDRRFTPEEREMLRLIAERAAIALDNRRLYRELQERDRRKDEFLAMLSHELRNPLGAIAAAAQLLEYLELQDERAIHATQVISRQSAYLGRMIDDLLDVSRVTAGRITLDPVVLDLRELADSAIESLHTSHRLDDRLVTVIGERVSVRADAVRMEQVLTNLLVNAVKYTNPGGRIQVEIEAREEHAFLRVIDDGMGIASDLLKTVFDLFVQGGQTLDRGQGGLGVGLTLVRRLTELQGGSVHAYSPGAGQGSTFEIELPLALDVPEPRSSETHMPAGRPLRVLLVDDNEDVREMLRTYLEMQGHRVQVAANGPEAVEAAVAVTPDVAFVDLGLPGFDGFEVARRLRDDVRTSRTLLVALTGYGQPEDRERTASAGFEAHLVKPVSQERLAEILAGVTPVGEAPANAARG